MWHVVNVVGRSVSARYTSPVRARIAIAYGFCFDLSSQVVTSSYGGNSAFAFLVAWIPSRSVGLRAKSLAPRRTHFSGGSMINTSRVRAATCWHV